jgi:asparagine synthase (glutamine-hydrolysing)
LRSPSHSIRRTWSSAICGIAGYHGTRELDESRIASCLRTLYHRGPDASATRRWTGRGGNTYLLSARLTIIDFDSRANQPFELGDKVMAYNGELYNYLEVKRDLLAQGRSFRTESDTEVMLSAIDTNGWDGLDDCEGMWGLAMYDASDGSLTLARDRFGEKPLHVFRDETGVYFGSEVKQIAALLGRWPAIDDTQLKRYLVNGFKALGKTDATFFEGVSQVEAGNVLRIDRDGQERRSQYWSPRIGPEEEMSYDDAVAGVKERLIRATELRLRADVPIAFCMSGGVDSVSLISVATKVLGYDVHGFTILSRDERYDERDLVRHVVSELGIRHDEIETQDGPFLEELKQLVHLHDGPVATISYYVQWLLMRAIAAHGYRVSVSGTGADEIFSGYYDHHLAYLADIRGDAALHAKARAEWTEHVSGLVRNPFLSDPDRFVEDPEFRDHIFLNADVYASYLKTPWHEPFSEIRYAPGLLRNRMLNELFHEIVPVILHEDDLNAMSYSIENRSPFLDRALFEFSSTIPVRHLVRDGRAKAVLRDAMRGIAPARILAEREKVGFNASILELLDAGNPAVQREILDDSPIYDYVRREAVEELLQRETLPNSDSKFLFNVLNAKFFVEQLGVGFSDTGYPTGPPLAIKGEG